MNLGGASVLFSLNSKPNLSFIYSTILWTVNSSVGNPWKNRQRELVFLFLLEILELSKFLLRCMLLVSKIFELRCEFFLQGVFDRWHHHPEVQNGQDRAISIDRLLFLLFFLFVDERHYLDLLEDFESLWTCLKRCWKGFCIESCIKMLWEALRLHFKWFFEIRCCVWDLYFFCIVCVLNMLRNFVFKFQYIIFIEIVQNVPDVFLKIESFEKFSKKRLNFLEFWKFWKLLLLKWSIWNHSKAKLDLKIENLHFHLFCRNTLFYLCIHLWIFKNLFLFLEYLPIFVLFVQKFFFQDFLTKKFFFEFHKYLILFFWCFYTRFSSFFLLNHPTTENFLFVFMSLKTFYTILHK